MSIGAKMVLTCIVVLVVCAVLSDEKERGRDSLVELALCTIGGVSVIMLPVSVLVWVWL